MAPSGPDLAWGRAFHAGFVRSLRLLATHMDTVPRFAAVRAIRGESAFALSDQGSGARFAHALGFDFVRIPEAATRWGRFHEFWANFYSRMLIWTYNPASLRGKGITQLRRYQLWMSRARFDQRYGALKTDGDL